ncbi:hypothetical protein ACJBU6_05765 [Exserohilum turcicum]
MCMRLAQLPKHKCRSTVLHTYIHRVGMRCLARVRWGEDEESSLSLATSPGEPRAHMHVSRLDLLLRVSEEPPDAVTCFLPPPIFQDPRQDPRPVVFARFCCFLA